MCAGVGTVERETYDVAVGCVGAPVAAVVACNVLGVARLSSIDLELTGALFSLSRRVEPDLCASKECAACSCDAAVATPAADVVGPVGVGVDALAPALIDDDDVLVGPVAADVEFDGLTAAEAAEATAEPLSAALALEDDDRDFDSR